MMEVMKQQLMAFVVRWVLSGFGLWISVSWFGTITDDYGVGTFLLSGLVFSLINSIVKPFATLFSLPLILLTMGLFTLIVNALMVYLTFSIVPGLEMKFWGAFLSGIIMSAVNYLVNVTLQPYKKDRAVS